MLPFLFLFISSVSCTLTPLDVLSVIPYKFYIVSRSRWATLNAHAGYHNSDKVLKFKTVSTAMGDIKVPMEDMAKLKDLSQSEYLSILNTKQPFDGEEDTLLGLELIEEGEFDDALEILENVLDNVNKSVGKEHVMYANACADLGYLYYSKKHYLEAMKWYTEAMTIDAELTEEFGVRNYAASANMLAICAVKAGQDHVQRISAILEKVFHALLQASDTDRYKILVNLANIYQRGGLPVRSIAILKVARHLLKKDINMKTDVNLYLGTAYVMNEDYKGAKTLLSAAVSGYITLGAKENPLYMEALYQLATIDLMTGQPERAFKQLLVVKEQMETLFGKESSESALLVCTMGQALLAMGETTKAVLFLETAQQVAHKDTTTKTGLVDLRIHYYLAQAYEKTGSLNKATDAYETVLAAGTHLLGKKSTMLQDVQNHVLTLTDKM